MAIRIIKLTIYAFLFAILLYGGYVWYQEKNAPLSPIPENGIKVIRPTVK